MNHRTRSSATTATAALMGAALLLGVTACANIDNLLHQRHEESFDDYAAAAEGWVGVDIPAWIPDDSTQLHNLATNDETVSVTRVTTASDLPADCVEQARHGIPVFDVSWSTDAWPDTVSLCGDYEVMAMSDGWLGWFNPASEGDTPG